ncbi:MAG: sigma-54-dependent Fis family transcriptional regulator [Phycisphaerales bacterium]|nr:MAG: sigma-54-dependent Fis family transcriptional regulator [Phycisphaerales bacterium]
MAEICVVDDQEILRDSLAAVLGRQDHAVETFADPLEALAAARSRRFDLIVSDLKMPRLDGIGLLRRLREADVDAPVIVMTAFATVGTAVEALKLGAFDYVQKPFEPDVILAAVERALEHARLRAENEALRTSVQDLLPRRELVGSGAAMQALRDLIERVGGSEATVLITGESGSGKELVASAIHAASNRRDRPMLCLNCAALSATLLESELFGHERGAFTGADRTRKGRFEMADGGTLLLDEISEMALPLQAKLLRVLQEGQFERVGSSVTQSADVRVIATTNRNLDEWVARRRFRGDLYYRLNVLPVAVPTLRDRVEDVPELVQWFLSQAARQDGRAALSVAPDAMALLKAYEWPGNVRELENICRRAATLCRGGTIDADLLRPWIRNSVVYDVDLGPLREGRMLEDMERKLIERTLARHNGHRANSARALGMGVRTLGMKLKQWREEDRQRRERLETVGTGAARG